MAEEGEDQSTKTEDPTPRKLSKAREKGDVPHSREAGTAMMILALLILTVFLMPQVASPLMGVLSRVFETAGTAQIGEGRAGMQDIGQVAGLLSRGILIVLAPVMGLFLLAAVAGVLLQGDIVIAAERIRPKWSKLSPMAGFKRMISPDALVEFLKSVLKVLVVGAVAVWLAYRAVIDIWQSEGFLPEAIAPYFQHYVAVLLAIVAVMAVVVALADTIYKRLRWIAKQRMSVKDVRDEIKEQEGDPLIKAKRMETRRKRSRQRMATAVPEATVILTNPTHYAVALKYEQGEHEAPICTAKGADLMAAQIRKLARDAGVPVIENRPLARKLYEIAEIDEPIPVEHWQAAAEIIRFVFDLRQNIRRQPPAGSSIRED
ncbi:flagellar biosynthesis protein FlhB [Seohaeicola nanhaiensis]|uniref:Flagellar biosynthetic protein FlhB n=1 Tax=Seohaeicola nanhaiensis TaxID=1387282 RepID=A0ABV9KHB3_9RHOB